VVYVRSEDIIISNSRLDRQTIDAIKAGFELDKYAFPMGLPTGKGVILTDGNHRATAVIELGWQYVPVVPLTKEEFDYVKFSDRKLDITARLPERVLVVK
jgi:hypothetical protein